MERHLIGGVLVAVAVWVATAGGAQAAPGDNAPTVGRRLPLQSGWLLKSSVGVGDAGDKVSRPEYRPDPWLPAGVPSTVLTALVKNGIYPDPRIGLNAYRIPDSSEEFNKAHDLAKFSYLPDQRNPWRDPYWYRTEFDLPPPRPGEHLWLNFNSINYRAEVWLNGARIADREHMVGMFQRFQFDITAEARPGRNVLAVKVWPVDHPGVPDTQLKVLGPHRGEHKEIEFDVTEIETAGYDCMMTVPDRNMGICQEVWVDFTGPVAVRNPFVVTRLPLPETNRATLAISAELANATASAVKGVLRGSIAGTDVRFEQPVELGPHETRVVAIDPRPVIAHPRLWWPVNYGEQYLYDLVLRFEIDGAASDEQKVAFGVREVTSEMHELDGSHGRRVLVNGRRIFCRGGYIQPELMLDWDARRIENEIRYFAEANMNLIYFEDIPNPPDAFLDACDRYGVLFGNCFYACSWVTTPGRPQDAALLERCTVDLVKRYRNHPSLVMYMAMNEGYTCREVYEMWRRQVVALDGTRFRIPSAYFPDYVVNDPANAARFAHFRNDLPTGMNDLGTKSYTWQEPVTYFRWVREDRSWMFKMESGSASLPPISSLAKFLPDLGGHSADGAPFPLTAAWAHHGANDYYGPYDAALRRLHGEPESVADYCWKGHLVTADQHRSMYEAVNHRMWDITSGFTEWKINACEPSVQWQIFDWYLKPMVSYFYIKKACEPLHVQFNLPDRMVSVINTRHEAQPDLEVTARLYDFQSKVRWEKTEKAAVPASAFKEAFAVPNLPDLGPISFVKLELRDARKERVSDNFYWLAGGTGDGLKALQKLPPVKLEMRSKVEVRGGDTIVTASISNPTDQLAFFIQLAVTKGPRGEEALPVLWSDNYFSLLPRESREITARISTADLAGTVPTLEVGGWNVQSEYECRNLATSKAEVKPNEPLTVTAEIANSFLDGSRVVLTVDGKPVAAKWAWARADKRDTVAFALQLDTPGKHEIRVGSKAASIVVR